MPKSNKKNYIQFRPDFGIGDLHRLVAERDDALAQYYIGHGRFLTRALNRTDPASVFIGARGVGKSAILQMIRLQEAAAGNADRIIDVAPDDLAFNALVNIKARTPLLSSPGENHWLFKSLWDYVLVVAILEKEERDRSQMIRLMQSVVGGRGDREQAQLMKITFGDDGSSKMTMTDKMLALVDAIQLHGEYAGASVGADVKLRAPTAGHEDLKLLQLISNVAKDLPNQIWHEYYILIDDLDLHWQGTPLQNTFLGTLFYSMRKLSFSPKLKFVVSLRKNIFRQIDLEERDKFSDLVCEVNWQKPTVREMIERRMEYALNLNAAQVWKEAFPPNSFDELWSNTNGMPREVIRLAIRCVEIAQDNGHNKVEPADVRDSIRRFSEERLDELASDCQYQSPGLKSVVMRFSGGKPEFDIEYIRDAAFRAAEKDGSNSFATWAEAGVDDPIGFAQTLLRCGFLLLKNGRDAKPHEPDADEIDQLDESNWYAVHPTFRVGLGLHGTSN